MSLRWSSAGSVRILDFDVEARPLSWIGGDFVSKEITAIAWRFVDEPETQVRTAEWFWARSDAEWESNYAEMLLDFLEAYNQADIVTGHYIRGFDLPTINGALLENGFEPLASKLTQDTKGGLAKRHGVSVSQQSLGAMLRLERDKEAMDQGQWRRANRLTPEGVAETRRRVVGDVEQHIEMRRELLELGWLGPPIMWHSGGGVRVAECAS